MKKLFMFFLACVIIGHSGTVCNAGSDSLGEKERQTDFGIYATYVAGETDSFTASVEDGEGEIRLPDGTVITVSDVPEEDWTLVVYPVADQNADAWEWFVACMEGKGRSIAPYEIYFLNQDGDRILADGVTIRILLPESMEQAAVFSLDHDGTAAELSSEIADGKISFQADGSYYYVLTDGAAASATPTPSITPEPSGEPTITPAPSITPGPSGEPTITPAPSITPEPSREPTSTPTPSITPEPSGKPTSTPAPSSTPEPSGEPTSTPAPGTTGNGTGTGGTTQGTAAQTGDETNIAGWLIALCTAGGCILYVFIRRKNSASEE